MKYVYWYIICVLTIEGVKAPICWCIFLLVESDVPFANNMCGVAGALKFVGNSRDIKRHTIGLSWPNHTMLKSQVDLTNHITLKFLFTIKIN